MHNKVVYQTAKSLDALGIPVLRFNFRGAGLSGGEHDRGRGEQDERTRGARFPSGEFRPCRYWWRALVLVASRGCEPAAKTRESLNSSDWAFQ